MTAVRSTTTPEGSRRTAADRLRPAGATLVMAAALALAGCAAGGPRGAGSEGGGLGGWDALARPRPEPLEGAAGVSLGDLTFLPAAPFQSHWALPPGVAVMELVAADLLQRRDIHLVERRRFAAAAERARRGQPPLPGQPPLGTSRGADFLLTGSWVRTPEGGALDLRLVHPETGRVSEAWRTATPAAPDAAGLARAVADGLTVALSGLGHLPDWEHPARRRVDAQAGAQYRDSGVPAAALEAFVEGVAAEDRFDWDAARRGYERALREAGQGFPEPRMALERTARLRAGGSLGGSD